MKHKIKLTLFVLLSLVFSGCATVPSGQKKSNIKPIQDIYLKDACQRLDIAWDWDQITQIITLRKGDVTVTMLIDSNFALYGNKQIELIKPLRVKKGAILIPKDFHDKILVIFEKAEVAADDKHFDKKARTGGSYRLTKIREVVIDAGHGGKDPGAMGNNNSKEKEIVLDISKRVKRLLEKQNIKVFMTRPDDQFVTLQGRTEIASKTQADAFISIHANSSPKKSVSGIEIFSLRELTQAEKDDENRRLNRKLLLSNLATNSNDKNVAFIVEDLLTQYKGSESIKLARIIGDNLSRTTKATNRGTKTAGFYVLRNTFVPAVLIEVGFLSNPKEERLLKSSSYRDKIAAGIANSLLEYSQGK
ncbi:MAG: N-acetylmuramoyl-L-alanine amidase [Candidatus Omnitrophica bacterium]|nr:N-acetylmuramoyl-L-alanine amidase [Candidatus Omnitrophota bacterium]